MQVSPSSNGLRPEFAYTHPVTSSPASRALFVTSRSKATGCSPDAVLDLVRRPATWPDWQMEIVSAEGPEVLEVGDVATGHASMLGFNVHGQAVAQHSTPDTFRHFVVVGVGMTVSYDVQETANGAILTHTIESALPTGPLGALLSFFLKRRLKRMQARLIDELVAQAEA